MKYVSSTIDGRNYKIKQSCESCFYCEYQECRRYAPKDYNESARRPKHPQLAEPSHHWCGEWKLNE